LHTRILLLGDPDLRPDGLERAIVRAGYAIAEAVELPAAPGDSGSPDLTILSVASDDTEWDRALLPLTDPAWRGTPTIVLLPQDCADAASRALALGAADAMVAPIHLQELCARVAVRIRETADGFRSTSSASVQAQLFHVFAEVALAARPEEMLQVLVAGLGRSLDLAHVACLLPTEGGNARVVAVAEERNGRPREVVLADYPEVARAIETGRTVYIPATADHPLFDGSRAALPSSAAAVPVPFQGRTVGYLALRTERSGRSLSADDIAFVETLVGVTSRLLDLEERRATLYRRQASAGVIDPLTGCGGLDALERRLSEELFRASRYARPFALALLDVRGLRRINQAHGVEAGDQVMAELGSVLMQELRGPDFVARYGGDEFALILPETDTVGALDTVRRIERALARQQLGQLEQGAIGFTVGVAAFPQEGVLQAGDALAVAERALSDAARADRAGGVAKSA